MRSAPRHTLANSASLNTRSRLLPFPGRFNPVTGLAVRMSRSMHHRKKRLMCVNVCLAFTGAPRSVIASRRPITSFFVIVSTGLPRHAGNRSHSTIRVTAYSDDGLFFD